MHLSHSIEVSSPSAVLTLTERDVPFSDLETDTGLVFTCTWIPLFTRLSSTSCLHSSSNPLSGSGFLHTTWTSAPKPE